MQALCALGHFYISYISKGFISTWTCKFEVSADDRTVDLNVNLFLISRRLNCWKVVLFDQSAALRITVVVTPDQTAVEQVSSHTMYAPDESLCPVKALQVHNYIIRKMQSFFRTKSTHHGLRNMNHFLAVLLQSGYKHPPRMLVLTCSYYSLPVA